MKVKLCKDCVWSEPEENSSWVLRCQHPIVNSKDAWALSQAKFTGTACREEREVRWFASCGMKGKLWHPKDV
jgi:hypothetical protein